MVGEYVTYLGRVVPKKGFRVFIYKDGKQKLVESWDEFKAHMDSGEWFPTKEAMLAPAQATEPVKVVAPAKKTSDKGRK